MMKSLLLLLKIFALIAVSATVGFGTYVLIKNTTYVTNVVVIESQTNSYFSIIGRMKKGNSLDNMGVIGSEFISTNEDSLDGELTKTKWGGVGADTALEEINFNSASIYQIVLEIENLSQHNISVSASGFPVDSVANRYQITATGSFQNITPYELPIDKVEGTLDSYELKTGTNTNSLTIPAGQTFTLTFKYQIIKYNHHITNIGQDLKITLQ